MAGELQKVMVAAFIAMLSLTAGYCGSLTGCPVNTQEFVSFNRNLLPLSNVRATSENTGFNHAEDLVKHSSQDNPPWCSEGDITTVTDHHIELNFTEPVVLTLMESSGYYNGYVNSFSIEYGPLDGELSTYTVNGETQDFQVGNVLLSNTYFTLGQPIVAQRLRLLINEAVLDSLNRICWELVLYGCRLSEVTETGATPTSSMTTMETSPTPPPTPTDVTCAPVNTEGATKSLETMDILIIVLPIALGTILIVLMITIAGVLICLKRSGKEKQGSKDGSSYMDSVTVHMVDGEHTKKELSTRISGLDTPKSGMSFLYDSPRTVCYDVPRASVKSRTGSEGGSSDLLSGTFEIKNPLYSLKRKCSQQEPQDMFVIDDGGNDYEMIPDRVPTNHAPSIRQSSLPPSVGGRSPDPPPSLPIRTHTYSLVKKRGKNVRSIHRSTQDLGKTKERINESIYNTLSKVAGSADPMFHAVYDEPCNDAVIDLDNDIDSSVV